MYYFAAFGVIKIKTTITVMAAARSLASQNRQNSPLKSPQISPLIYAHSGRKPMRGNLWDSVTLLISICRYSSA